MFCNKCGSPVSQDDYVCKMCGNVINEANRVIISQPVFQVQPAVNTVTNTNSRWSYYCVTSFIFSFIPIIIVLDILFAILGINETEKKGARGFGFGVAGLGIGIIKHIAIILYVSIEWSKLY